MEKLKLSALDLATVCKGQDAEQAIARSVEAAQWVEKLGYNRIWLAEHHNMEYVASSATVVLIGHIASKTQHIRVGSGGIMLPNHSPLVVAEQFGTLETLYRGRIDLGLGRAPGTDQVTAMALRRNNLNTAFYFKDDVLALQQYFENDNPLEKVRAFPGEGLDIPLYILGSSTDSAHLAAQLGLPYAFAAHFAPAMLAQAAEIYKGEFKPSRYRQEPYFMACVNMIGAETREEADFLSTSLLNMFASIVTNYRRPLSPPTKQTIYHGIPEIEQAVQKMMACTFTGDQMSLKQQADAFVERYQVDEIITTNYIYDNDKRLESFRIIRDALSPVSDQPLKYK